ncbi:exodeoxyribonuclease VII large subunit [Candidatus Saccharibacteria bacterium]|nr:exodeoxyribonuclease VII large subunit [Candidatus Saccharibacteria bacterium]
MKQLEASKMNNFTPTEFIAVVNQTLEYAYPSALITGEVASFKINQGKWVFFDIKDETSSISCFMSVWNLRIPIEDGMKVTVSGVPKITKWGKFSFTVENIKPVGEGSIKKAYELLKKKLTAEGLFAMERKREIPTDLVRLGIISSTDAAGYSDFIKIINARWGGIKVTVAHTQVQGMDAPDQMIRALKYFNEKSDVQMIAILRGGGSADDLSCFNDEQLVREIAASKIPVITGIGHERDESLADLAADVRASTPSNAAEMLTRDRNEEKAKLARTMNRTYQVLMQTIERVQDNNNRSVKRIFDAINTKYIEPMLVANNDKMKNCLKIIQDAFSNVQNILVQKIKVLDALNPERVLSQGYAILSGKISPGEDIDIMTARQEIKATIKDIKERK